MGKVFKVAAKFVFLCFAPLILALVAVALLATDLLSCIKKLFAAQHPPAIPQSSDSYSRPSNASIVIPSWNGRELLAKNLPSVIAAVSDEDEIIVVDNGSKDGSADFIRKRFPRVKVVEADRNLGFGGGSNLGIQSARNRIAVLLNNDMRVPPDFLQPLLDGFTDEAVFAISSQIFFPDLTRRREETGLTSGIFERGFLRVRHEVDPDVTKLYPTFYAGGGSTAYDREKFLQLGGFDHLFAPFYLEDTDLSYCAWRRGWKVLYQPNSHVYHEHRATIAKHYSPEAILAYLQKNYILMVWKNVHRWRWLPQHFLYLYGHMILCWIGRSTETRTTIGAFILALKALPRALRCRMEALSRAKVNDATVFELNRPSVFRDVFARGNREQGTGNRIPSRASRAAAEGEGAVSPAAAQLSSHPGVSAIRPLNILFVSPYSIYPPIHGGAVFMFEAIRELAKRHNLYVLTFVDTPEQVESNRALEDLVCKVESYIRRPHPRPSFTLRPNAQDTFHDANFAALLDKAVYLHDIDVIQFEYAQLAQYRLPLRHTPQCLFEHDVYFRSVERQLFSSYSGLFAKAQEFLEWLRAVQYEIRSAGQFDAVFTCHQKEQRLLESMLNGRHPPVFPDVRVAIDVSSYSYPGGPRCPDSLLFVGSFQHLPNIDGLQYFCREILPLIRARRPSVTFSAVGAQPSFEIQRMLSEHGVRLLGQVPDIREPLSQYAVFVCPIRLGAGVRVKILEAFASGIPVVSTPLGAEGLRGQNGTHFLLADSPAEFATQTLHLLEHPDAGTAMAAEARHLAETLYDWPVVAGKLEGIYRQLLERTSTPLLH